MLSTKLRDRLREGRAELWRRDTYTEEDTRSVLISPFLDALGYDALHRKSELEDRGNTPDEVAFAEPPGISPQRHSRVILEAKPLGTNFDRGPSRTETPERQLKRYLQNHIAAGPNTFGVLTDGERYRVFERTGHLTDIRYVGEFNILEDSLHDEVNAIHELNGLLGRDALASIDETKPDPLRAARRLSSVISEPSVSSDWLLNQLVLSQQSCQPMDEKALTGRALDAYQVDWGRADWRYGPNVDADQLELEGARVVTGVVEFHLPEVGYSFELKRGDVALAARVFARKTNSRTAIVIARQANREGVIDKARVAVHHHGRTAMTFEFDPVNPPMSVLKSLDRIIRSCNRKRSVSPQRLIDAVTAKTIRKEFYNSISHWTLEHQRGRGELHRQAILRHLIRTVFAWVLKEDGILPSEPFDESFAQRHSEGFYHRDILTFLFHERLNVPERDRSMHSIADVDAALASTPFLNGSLFAEHEGDMDLELTNEDYFGVSLENPGLFTIMSRYDWTTAEHTPGESDQTIDPEMLSSLFENLFAATESDETLRKMPHGTYYTPSDVVTEMVKDALSTAVRQNCPAGLSIGDAELRDLFSELEPDVGDLSASEKVQILETMRGLSIFDPSVGSGAFMLTAAYALRTAINKLDREGPDPTRDIIQNQLHAQDINPMATQITRLRLFIAIMAAERGTGQFRPLPNLEGRIVCADTLATLAIPAWHTAITTDLAGTSPGLLDAINDRAGVLLAWRNAHTESEKSTVIQQDEAVRQRILAELRASGNEDHEQLMSFARHELLAADAEPASTDARLLFYQPEWQGFDVVIGNPPYEGIAEGRSPIERETAKIRLQDRLHYQTTMGGNLFNLFCEVALSLVKPEGGVVTLIVPLTIAFGQSQYATRQLFERRSNNIWLRHHDNRPAKTFHDSPVANPESRQRTTIVIAVTGGPLDDINTTGTSKWSAVEREQFISSRHYAKVPRLPEKIHANLSKQWPRIPTSRIGELIIRMMEQRSTISDFVAREGEEHTIGLPKTAYEFITVTPAGTLKRNETVRCMRSTEHLELAMAVLNGHVAHAWWRVWGDAFHVNPYEFTTIAIPDNWFDDPKTLSTARLLGRDLIGAVNPQNTVRGKSGTASRTFENVNFHEACPNIVDRIDELYLEALGMLDDHLLAQLRKLRSSSNWKLSAA